MSPLFEENVGTIGAVDLRVAHGAGLALGVLWMWPVRNSRVTLEAHRVHRRTGQQPRMSRAMRSVAGLAAFGLYRRVLEYERSFLVAMTVEAYGVLGGSRAQLAISGGVHIVAVRTFHQALIDAMAERLVELCPDLLVARVTQASLLIGEEVLRFFRLVDVVAGCAPNPRFCMRRPIEGHVFGVRLVTSHTTRAGFDLRDALEREYLRLVATGFDVRTAGSVTGFARTPGFATAILESSFVVRACFDLLELLLVASLAGL